MASILVQNDSLMHIKVGLHGNTHLWTVESCVYILIPVKETNCDSGGKRENTREKDVSE